MKKSEDKLNRLFIILGITLALNSLLLSYLTITKRGSYDLRNRVVGTRLLLAKEDPYFFGWKPDMPEEWVDPLVNPSDPVNRVTVPPTVLVLHSLMAHLPFTNQIIIWFIIQWLLLTATVVLLTYSTNSTSKRKLVIFIGLIFAALPSWQWHVIAGQIYILFAFLTSASFWVKKRLARRFCAISGLIIGLTASLRPPYILILLPMLFHETKATAAATIIGAMVGLGLPFILTDFQMWQSYISAMKIQGTYPLGRIMRDFNPSRFYPPRIEGVTFLDEALFFSQRETSIKGVIKRIWDVNVPTQILLGLLIILLAAITYSLYKNRRCVYSVEVIFLMGMVIVLLSEFFIPAAHYEYYNVQWIVPILLIIIASDITKLAENRLNILLVLSLAFYFVNSAASTWMFILYLILITMQLAACQKRAKVKLPHSSSTS